MYRYFVTAKKLRRLEKECKGQRNEDAKKRKGLRRRSKRHEKAPILQKQIQSNNPGRFGKIPPICVSGVIMNLQQQKM